MAGLRAGAAIGRPDLLAKLSSYGAGALPLTGMVGAHASLKSPKLVPERRKLIAQTRNDVFEFLHKHNAKFVPSVSNKFMVEWDKPGGEMVKAFAAEKIFIGRVWPAWPNHARVSIGTPEEMAKFKTAYKKIFGV
jgi:histidinol-phosphate/aromatic aminotransferase/cobyric acid decarboxylase-like protein